MREHRADDLGHAGLAGEGGREFLQRGDLRGGRGRLLQPTFEDGIEQLVGVRRLDQREVGVLGEGGVGGIRFGNGELQDLGVVRLGDAGLRNDAQQAGLGDFALGRGEVGGSEAGEAHAGGEDGVLEHEVGITRKETADGLSDSG